MYKKIIDYKQSVVGSVNASCSLSSFSPDSLLFRIANLFGKIDKSTATEAEKGLYQYRVSCDPLVGYFLNISLKNESGKDVQIVKNVPLTMLYALSNYNGGMGKDCQSGYPVQGYSSTAGTSDVIFSLNLGNIVLTGDDRLDITITGQWDGCVSSDEATGEDVTCPLQMKVWAVDDVKRNETLLTYQFVNSVEGQSYSFNDAYDIFASKYIDVSKAIALSEASSLLDLMSVSDVNLYLIDEFGTQNIDLEASFVSAMCKGRLEANTMGNYAMPFGFSYPWHDNTSWGQSVRFDGVKGYGFLVIGESFHLERQHKIDKDVRDFGSYYQRISEEDSEKFAIISNR